MKKVRFISMILAAMLLLCLVPVPAGAVGSIAVSVQPVFLTERSGTAFFTITNTTDADITITRVEVKDNKLDGTYNLAVQSALEPVGVTKQGGIATGSITLGTNQDLYNNGSAGTATLVFYTTNDQQISVPIQVYSGNTMPDTTPGQGGDNSSQGEKVSALVLDSTDFEGKIVPAPSGDAGDTIKVILPIKNRAKGSVYTGAGGYVTGVEITPQLSANLDEFPFEITELDYKRSINALSSGSKAIVEYNLKLSPKATSGVKAVTFNAVYYVDGVLETAQFKVYVTVVKGAAAAPGGDGSAAVTSEPKVIIKSYKLDPQEIIAGETFKLTLELYNTSDKEDVKNLKITVSNADGVILPAPSGSSTLYVKKIGKGDTATTEIELQSAPDIAAKAHSLSVQFNYEGGSTLTAYNVTETLSLNVTQPIRIRLDEPVIYGDGMTGQPFSASFSLYNMGKSAIYNCMVDVEADGMKLEEMYYGGNVASGSSMRADFNVIPSVAGDISGNFIVTYEDVYGKEYTEKLPFTIFVMDMTEPAFNEGEGEYVEPMEPMEEPSAGMPWWVWTLIGLVAAAAIIVGVTQLRRRRRRRELEED